MDSMAQDFNLSSDSEDDGVVAETTETVRAPRMLPIGYSRAMATSVRFCESCGMPNDRSDESCSECGTALSK
jgi:hypothetical protein